MTAKPAASSKPAAIRSFLFFNTLNIKHNYSANA